MATNILSNAVFHINEMHLITKSAYMISWRYISKNVCLC